MNVHGSLSCSRPSENGLDQAQVLSNRPIARHTVCRVEALKPHQRPEYITQPMRTCEMTVPSLLTQRKVLAYVDLGNFGEENVFIDEA